MPKNTDFNDLAALRSAIAAQRDAILDDNSLVTARAVEPILAALLQLAAEVEDLRKEVKSLRQRQILGSANQQTR